MKANIKKVKKLILADEELINYFVIIAMYYNSQTEGKIERMRYKDYDFFNFVKNVYCKDEKALEFYNNKVDDELKKGISEYFCFFDKKEKILDTYNLDTMAFNYYLLNYYEAKETHATISMILYLANKYKNTNFEKRIKDFLLSIINYKKDLRELEANKKNKSKEEQLALESEYIKKENAYFLLRFFFYDFCENGNLSNTTLLREVKNMNDKDNQYIEAEEKLYFKLKEVVKKESKDKQEKVLTNSLEEYIVKGIKERIKKNTGLATSYNQLKERLVDELETIAKEEDIDITLTDEEQKIIKDNVNSKAKEVNKYTTKEALEVSNITYYFGYLAFDKELLDFLIDNTIIEYTHEDEIKEEYKDRYKKLDDSIIIKKPRKTKKEHALTEEMIKNNKEWLKVNNSKISKGILDARDEIITYQESNLERQERELKELEEEYNKTHNKEILQDIEEKKIDIEESRKKHSELCDEIKDKEAELKTLERLCREAEDEEVKKEYQKLLKKKNKEIKELKQKRDNRGLNKQLDLFTNVLEVKNEVVTLSIPYEKFNISNYTSEGKRLLVYIQNQLYYNPTNDYIVVDNDEYLEQTGRKKSTARAVRKKLDTSLKAMFQESVEINLKNEAEERELKGQIRLIQEFWQEKYKGKLTFRIKLTDAYKKILLNEKAMTWASIPILLNRLNGTKAEERAREIGFYLYQMLRSDLKNQKVGYDYNKTFKMKTLTKVMIEKGLTNNYETYAKNIIIPLQDALNRLEDLGFIEYHTNAFLDYEGYYNEEKNEFIKGTLGTSETNIKHTFESESIIITFKIADYEEYDKIISKRAKKINIKPKKKKE